MEGLAAYSGSCSDGGSVILKEKENRVNLRISYKFVIVYFQEIFCFLVFGKIVLWKNFNGQLTLVKSYAC